MESCRGTWRRLGAGSGVVVPCLLLSAPCQWELLSCFHFILGVICDGNREVPFLFAATECLDSSIKSIFLCLFLKTFLLFVKHTGVLSAWSVGITWCIYLPASRVDQMLRALLRAIADICNSHNSWSGGLGV